MLAPKCIIFKHSNSCSADQSPRRESLIRALPARAHSESSDKSLTYGLGSPALLLYILLDACHIHGRDMKRRLRYCYVGGKDGMWSLPGGRSLGALPRSLAIKYPWLGGRGGREGRGG